MIRYSSINARAVTGSRKKKAAEQPEIAEDISYQSDTEDISIY